jgi:ABC-type antimicrobial peptide transport system permease subunit
VQLRILSAFAFVAFALAGIGIHGLLSFAVAHRTQEIGVRMALGAGPADIVGMVLRRCAALAVGGLVPGVAAAFAVGRGMQALLAGVAPSDGPTLGAAIGLVVVMTMAGGLFPALRALRVDPVKALRAE